MSENEQGLAIIEPGRPASRQIAVLPTSGEWTQMSKMASDLYRSNMLPKGITSAYAALAIIEKGRELGVSAMMAISHINMIDGKPSADAQILAGLIYSAHGDNALEVVEETDDSVTVAYKRRGWAKARTTTFTIEDARRAGLTNKQNWQKYPKAMLTARAISKAAHMAFQDVVGGMYTPDELGKETNDQGQLMVTELPARPPSSPKGAARPTTEPEPEVVEGELMDMASPSGPPPELLPPDYDENDPEDARQRLEVRCEQLSEYASLIGHEQSLQINGVDVDRLSAERLYEWTKKLETMFDCVSATADDVPAIGTL